jgi:pectin methylesterase-like acyl-CoA thioesterase
MRNLLKFFIITALLFFVLQVLFPQSGPLNGIYTIGTSSNFPSFKAAVDSLKSKGISGPVVFNIKNGTYNEQISIPAITGTSAIKTITFQSESNDSTKVILSYSDTEMLTTIIKI